MANRKKYYLAGPMTGLPGFNYERFNSTTSTLRGFGFDIANPAEHKLPSNASYNDYLKAGIKKMMDCDTVILLPGWENSNGARLERELAIKLNMDIIESEDFLNFLDKQAERL